MEPVSPANKAGTWVAFATAGLTLGTFVQAFLTPPLSGPLCVAEHCYAYPFADIASRFPRDYLWMVPAIVLSLLYVALVACVCETAAPGKRIFALLGLIAASLSAAMLVADYFLQLTVIQPSVLAGEADGVAMLSQYNAHGVFIALEELGYLLMALSFGCLAPAFAGSRAAAVARWVLALGCFSVAACFLGFLAAYGVGREYRFEIAVISLDWFVLLAGSIAIGFDFRARSRA